MATRVRLGLGRLEEALDEFYGKSLKLRQLSRRTVEDGRRLVSSPSGRGHIVTIVGIEGDRVRFADPAHGKIRETTKDEIHRAPSYPQGSFIFLPFRFRF